MGLTAKPFQKAAVRDDETIPEEPPGDRASSKPY